MAGTETVAQRLVVVRALVAIVDDEGNGGAQRFPVKDSAQPFHLIGFVSACGEGRRGVTFAPSEQFGSYQRVVDNKSGWTTVDDAAQGCAVGFAEGCQPE